jgi:hypothetical protein
MSPIDPTAQISASSRATVRSLADGSGAVVLHLDTAAYHGLNEMGSLIWGIVEEGVTFGTLIERVRAEVDGAPPTLSDEITAFVRDLEARGLVTIG